MRVLVSEATAAVAAVQARWEDDAAAVGAVAGQLLRLWGAQAAGSPPGEPVTTSAATKSPA